MLICQWTFLRRRGSASPAPFGSSFPVLVTSLESDVSFVVWEQPQVSFLSHRGYSGLFLAHFKSFHTSKESYVFKNVPWAEGALSGRALA